VESERKKRSCRYKGIDNPTNRRREWKRYWLVQTFPRQQKGCRNKNRGGMRPSAKPNKTETTVRAPREVKNEKKKKRGNARRRGGAGREVLGGQTQITLRTSRQK